MWESVGLEDGTRELRINFLLSVVEPFLRFIAEDFWNTQEGLFLHILSYTLLSLLSTSSTLYCPVLCCFVVTECAVLCCFVLTGQLCLCAVLTVPCSVTLSLCCAGCAVLSRTILFSAEVVVRYQHLHICLVFAHFFFALRCHTSHTVPHLAVDGKLW